MRRILGFVVAVAVSLISTQMVGCSSDSDSVVGGFTISGLSDGLYVDGVFIDGATVTYNPVNEMVIIEDFDFGGGLVCDICFFVDCSESGGVATLSNAGDAEYELYMQSYDSPITNFAAEIIDDEMRMIFTIEEPSMVPQAGELDCTYSGAVTVISGGLE